MQAHIPIDDKSAATMPCQPEDMSNLCIGRESAFQIKPSDAPVISSVLNRSVYFSNPFFLSASCLAEQKMGDLIISALGELNQTLMFLPKDLNNIKAASTIFLYDNHEAERLQLEKVAGLEINSYGMEYFYDTKKTAELPGSRYSDFRKRIKQFERSINFEIVDNFNITEVENFVDSWAASKNVEGRSTRTIELLHEDIRETKFYLRSLEYIEHKKLFVHSKGELLGFSIFGQLNDQTWYGLCQKTLPRCVGLAQLLYQLKASAMRDIPEFTTGPAASDAGLAAYKQSLRPSRTPEIYIASIPR